MINCDECEEVFEFLSYMNKTEVMKIPEEILNYIKKNRNENFKTKINKNDLFNFKNLSTNALDFLIYIDNTFWNDNLNCTNQKRIDIMAKNVNTEPKKEELELKVVKEKNLFLRIINKIFNRMDRSK